MSIRGLIRLPLLGLLGAFVLSGCGSSPAKPTSTPILPTITPQPTPTRIVVVVTGQASPTPIRVTVVVTPKTKHKVKHKAKRTPTPKPTKTPTPRPTKTPKPTPKPTKTPRPAPKHKHHPKPTATARPHRRPTPRPRPTPTRRPRPTATPRPRPTPTHRPRPTPTHRPRPTPTHRPRPTPTHRPRPTATARPRPTATRAVTAHAHVTPTPIPTARPRYRVPQTGTITHPAASIRAAQRGANAHNPAYAFYTNPVQVVRANLSQYGFTRPFRIRQPILISFTSGGREYNASLEELVKRTPDGAWFLVEISRVATSALPGPTAIPTGTHPFIGVIHHTAADTVPVQQKLDALKPAYVYYLNPIAVLMKKLPTMGFTKPIKIVQPLRFVVNYGSRQYDVYLTQPGLTGLKGIWVISAIRPFPA